MRALWTQEEAYYSGQFVSFGPSWAWPKPVQEHLPVIIGAGAGPKTFAWIAANADGWLTTPKDEDLPTQARELTAVWREAGRKGNRSSGRSGRSWSCSTRTRRLASRGWCGPCPTPTSRRARPTSTNLRRSSSLI